MKDIAFQRITLEARIQEVFDEVEGDVNALFNAVCDAKPNNLRLPASTWEFGWALTFKKVLRMYLIVKNEEPLLEEKTASSFRFEDYSFSCRRIPGPWLPDASRPKSEPPPEWLLWEGAGPWSPDGSEGNRKPNSGKAIPSKPLRKLTFGLEVCADHSELRLAKSMKSWTEANPTLTIPPIDVQLVPSAGMTIAHDKIVARKGGYIFNCDGWIARGAGVAQKMKDRGAMVLDVLNEDAPDDAGHNPLSPHSELCLSSGPAGPAITITADKPTVSLKDLKVIGLPPEDQAKLFANGAGELHIYPLQPLVLD